MSHSFIQIEQGLMTYPREKWQQMLWKAPIYLVRLGLAPVVGHHLLLITHTGRKSGLPRRTMVEYHMLDGKKYVPCAFGRKAQWYRNMEVDPRVTLQSAHGTEGATAVRVTDDKELIAVYELFKRRDPPLLNWYMNSLDIRHEHADILAKKERIYWIRFDPINELTLPGMEEDLKWVLPVTAVSLLILWFTFRRR